ncbi:hypothetical protein ScPMuIL_015745 [Solemya velum]
MNSDTSSDEDTLQIQAFAVENDSESDKNVHYVNGMPVTSSDYLRSVRLEAKDCPRVVVSDIKQSTFSHKQTVLIKENRALHPACRGFSPSWEWQRLQVANFSSIRQSLTRYCALMKKNKIVPPKLPACTDVDAWCQLCFGRLKPPFPPKPSSAPPTTADEPIEVDTVLEESPAKPVLQQGIGPLLSVVTAMDQYTVFKVLKYHLNWFEATGFSEHQGQWFYALLACLTKPIDPDACSLLRCLARSAASLRATLMSPSDSRLVPLNLIICLVSVYFDQKDLMDSAS